MALPLLATFRPVRGADWIDTVGTYDYSGTCVGPEEIRRLIWTTGLKMAGLGGNDCLGSCQLLPHPPKPAAWTIATHLVADPAALWTGNGFVVFFTKGQRHGPLDGRMNGISCAAFDRNGKRVTTSAVRTIIAQSPNPATYGHGQPGVCALADNRVLMVYRTDSIYAEGAGSLEAKMLSWPALDDIEPVRFAEVEDGASPELVLHNGQPHIVLVAADWDGSGWLGCRRYSLDGGPAGWWLTRDRAAETAYPVRGGSFMALPGAVRLSAAVDGAAVVRDHHNAPVVTGGHWEVWRGHRTTLAPSSTWKLVREYLPVPA